MPRLEAASISITSSAVEAAMAPAVLAHAAGRDGRLGDRMLGVGTGAVERLGQDLGEAGLAGAARTREDVGVRHRAAAHGVLQGARDVILAGDLGEGLRTVFA